MKLKCAPEVHLSIRSKMGPCSGDVMVSKNNRPTAKENIHKNLYRCERHANRILLINPYRPFGGKIKFKVAKISKKPKVKSKPEAKKGERPKKVVVKVKKKRGRPKK